MTTCDNCNKCNGKGGRWDDESQDQWFWCEFCDAADQNFNKLKHLRNESKTDPLWIERCAELLGCDPLPSSIASEIQTLKDEVERARKTIAELRKPKPVAYYGSETNRTHYLQP